MRTRLTGRRFQFKGRSNFLRQKFIPRIHYILPNQPNQSRTFITYSSLNPWLLLLVSAGIVLSGSLYLQQTSASFKNTVQPSSSKDPALTEEYHGMVTAKLPGRPGNLTKEQETRLKELWTETFKVFGVEPLLEHGDVGEKNTEQRLDATDPDKKKKKRTNMFGRKRHGEDVDEAHTGDSDDKYGHTKEFQQTLATLTPEELREAFWSMVKHDNPDGLLLRFLRARKWDVQKALVMLIATMRWRLKDMRVDEDVVKNGEGAAAADIESSDKVVKKEGADFMAQLRLGKAFLHGTDKEGRPMCYVRVRLHRQGEQSEASLERYTVYIIETARLLLARDIDTAAIVFDMTDFSLANMDYGPIKFMIKCFEANYPESLGIVFVHKAPWIFQGIWNIIKGWLDPVVASKVHFTKTIQELEHFVQRNHIIKDLGGDDPYTYKYVEPTPNENALLADEESNNKIRTKLLDERAAIVREYEKVTQEWIKNDTAGAGDDDDDNDEKTTTTLQQKQTTTTRRNELTQSLRTGYWHLDPYLRAKTLYDRLGIIRAGGRIRFYDDGSDADANAPEPLSSKTTTTTKTTKPDKQQHTVAGHRDHELD